LACLSRGSTWLHLCSSGSTHDIPRCLNASFHSNIWIVLVIYPFLSVWLTNLQSGTCNFFFFFFFLYLDFYAWPYKFSKQPFNLFFLQIWSYSFYYYLFYLKSFMNFFFQFHPPLIFIYLSDLVPIILIVFVLLLIIF
jgi:hypothetical protein